MAQKTTRQHIENLEAMRDQGADASDYDQYILEEKVSDVEAKSIIDFVSQPSGDHPLRQLIGQGALMGFGDEIEGGLKGLMPGTSVDQEIDLARQRVKTYEQNYPERALPLTLGGGLLTGGVGTARAALLQGGPMLARMAQGAKTGAVYGGVGGTGSAEGGADNRIVGGLMGGLTGGATGGGFPVVSGAVRGISDSLRGSLPGASQRIAERNIREAAELDEVTPRMAQEVFDGGPPVMAGADLADPRAMALRNAARLAANTRGGVQGLRFVGDRADAQGQRINDTLEVGLPGKSLDDFLDEANDLRRVTADKNYAKFYENPVELDDFLKKSFEDEDFEEAYKLAKTIARREGTSLPPLFEVVDGNKIYAQPNARMLDYIKQGMDALVDRTYRSDGGTLGKSLQKVRDNYRDHLDSIMPDYSKARSEYAGISAAMEAAEIGEKFILNPRKISQNIFKRMGDHEKEAFRVGVAEALRMKINTSQDGANIVRKIFGSNDARQRLQLAFDNEEAFNAFQKAMEAEAKMSATAGRVLNVSSTAPMQADQASLGQLAVQAGEAFGNPMTALTRAAMAMKGGPANDEIAAETRNLLLNPVNQAKLLQVLAAANPNMQRQIGRLGPTLSNALAAQSSQINPMLPQ